MICPRCRQLTDDAVWIGQSAICRNCHQKSINDARKLTKIFLIGVGIIVVMTVVAFVLGAFVENLAEE